MKTWLRNSLYRIEYNFQLWCKDAYSLYYYLLLVLSWREEDNPPWFPFLFPSWHPSQKLTPPHFLLFPQWYPLHPLDYDHPIAPSAVSAIFTVVVLLLCIVRERHSLPLLVYNIGGGGLQDRILGSYPRCCHFSRSTFSYPKLGERGGMYSSYLSTTSFSFSLSLHIRSMELYWQDQEWEQQEVKPKGLDNTSVQNMCPLRPN